MPAADSGKFLPLQSRLSYLADFAVYPAGIACAAAYLLVFGPHRERLEIAGAAIAGLLGWSLLEYALHRFLLHGPEPFRRWHLAHHRQPRALIGTPTIVSVLLLLGLVFLPACLLGGSWVATGLALGVATGYLGYAMTHHALHHWDKDMPWLRTRRHLHWLHHSRPGCEYGVSTSIWDRVFLSRSDS